ncbi:hypothetical protein D3C85_961140 [compost metagenome]
MAEQTVQHTGQTTEQARPAEQVLAGVGYQADQQGQAEQRPTALAQLDAAAQFPVPHGIHGQVQDAEMHQHRRQQAPPLAGGQAFGQRGEIDIVALHAKIEKGQPMQCLEVFPKPGKPGDQQAQQQHASGDRTAAQLGDQARATGLLALRQALQLGVGSALGKAFVELANIFGQLFVGHPQDLDATLLADPVRHLQAPQQGDKATEVNIQRQAQYRYRAHRGTSGRSTSTHTNLRGSSCVSSSSR